MSRRISSVGVIGSGTMGAGIAQVAALAGMTVRLYDADADALGKGIERAFSTIEEGVRRGKVTPGQRDRARAGLTGASDLGAAVAEADLVIEAIPEVMELKQEIFARLEPVCRESANLATNTSSLSIAGIASRLSRPGRIVGLHFFNPPHIMKLVQVVRAASTDESVLQASLGFVSALGKEAIVVRDSPGFATSRLGLALGLEAMRMVEQEVASAQDIDRAMELGYGHPMGPLKVSDLVGLDVRLGIAQILHRALGSEQFRPPEILNRLVSSGKLGKKTGEGFHKWDPPGAKQS